MVVERGNSVINGESIHAWDKGLAKYLFSIIQNNKKSGNWTSMVLVGCSQLSLFCDAMNSWLDVGGADLSARSFSLVFFPGNL